MEGGREEEEEEEEEETNSSRSQARKLGVQARTTGTGETDARVLAIVNHQKILLQQIADGVELEVRLQTLHRQTLDIVSNFHNIVLRRRRKHRIILKLDSEIGKLRIIDARDVEAKIERRLHCRHLRKLHQQRLLKGSENRIVSFRDEVRERGTGVYRGSAIAQLCETPCGRRNVERRPRDAHFLNTHVVQSSRAWVVENRSVLQRVLGEEHTVVAEDQGRRNRDRIQELHETVGEFVAVCVSDLRREGERTLAETHHSSCSLEAHLVPRPASEGDVLNSDHTGVARGA